MAQAPLLPYMIDKLGARESNTYGLLMSTFSALQLVGSLLSGAACQWTTHSFALRYAIAFTGRSGST
jgi:hypothetical protein